jgi:hypothetical protein
MSARKHERYELLRKTSWDFFTAGDGRKPGYLTNISKGGCLMKTTELIEHRRWLRLLVPDEGHNVWVTLVGRVIRCEHLIEAISGDVTIYRYGIEFVNPGKSTEAELDDHLPLILAFSNKNATVRSCLSLNTKSS